MATLNFPDDPSIGDIYKDGNSGFSYEWNGTVWISTDPSTVSNIREIDDISGDFDGSDTTFTLKVSEVNVEPVNAQQLIISVGGVMQNAGQDFTVSGAEITFTTAPSSGLTFFGVLLGTALSLNTIPDGGVTPGSLTTTSNYVMNGLTLDQGAGIITAFGFQGGSITADLDSTFAANVSIAGSLTVQGTQTIINTDELNVQDKTIGIGSTNAPSSTTQDGSGAIIYGQTHIDILYDVDKAALGISTAVSVSGFVTATRAQVGTGVTINNTGVNATSGIVTAQVFSGLGATVGGGVTINNTGIDAGIGAGIVTASSFVGGGANITALSGSNIASGTVAAARVATLNQDTTGNAATATALETARNIGGVSFDGTAAINLPGVNQSGTQNTSGTAGGLSGTPDIDCGTGSFTGDVDIADKIVHTGDTNTAIRFPSADTITAETGGSERVRIESGGDVGINTDNPTVKLDISEDGVAFPSPAGSTLLRLRNAGGTATISIDAGTTANSVIQFGDTSAASVGTIQYSHTTDHMQFNTGGTGEKMRITSAGRLGIGTDDPQRKLEVWDASESNIRIEGGADYFELRVKDSDDAFGIHKNIAGAGSAEVLSIDANAGFNFSNGALVEKVKITAGKLSDNTNIDLENGMVHYFTTQETTTATPNIRINSSTSLNSGMSSGDCISVTLVTTAAAAGYSANLTIDGVAVTEEWVGGSAPSAGSADGLDIYTYTIICIHNTSTGDSGFKVIANLTNATN